MTDEEPKARPVQQVNNPVKAPVWKTTSMQFMVETFAKLEEYCEISGYSKRDVIDVALRTHFNMPEPNEE